MQISNNRTYKEANSLNLFHMFFTVTLLTAIISARQFA